MVLAGYSGVFILKGLRPSRAEGIAGFARSPARVSPSFAPAHVRELQDGSLEPPRRVGDPPLNQLESKSSKATCTRGSAVNDSAGPVLGVAESVMLTVPVDAVPLVSGNTQGLANSTLRCAT
jgi:hypothetical protein